MISLIIPAYFVDDSFVKMTNDCVKSVGSEVDEVIVVDDGSPIYPSGIFGRHRPSKHLLRLSENRGYSSATNAGLKVAQGDILIVGNNDLTFHKGWLNGLLKVLDEGFDVATCWTSDQKHKLEPVIKEGERFGSLFAMNREVYDTIGGFDEQFRGYFADDDYRERIKQAGFRIGMNYNMVVEHEAKATYKITDPKDAEFLRASRLFEAKWGYEL